MRELPTAVVCSNDMTAIGVLHGLYRTTHKVPDDISVVGFDDIHLAQFMLPPLTTVQMSCKDLADGGGARRCAPASSRTTPRPRRKSGRFPPGWWCASPRTSRGARFRRWKKRRPEIALPPRNRIQNVPHGAAACATTYTYSSGSFPVFSTLCRVAGGM